MRLHSSVALRPSASPSLPSFCIWLHMVESNAGGSLAVEQPCSLKKSSKKEATSPFLQARRPEEFAVCLFSNLAVNSITREVPQSPRLSSICGSSTAQVLSMHSGGTSLLCIDLIEESDS